MNRSGILIAALIVLAATNAVSFLMMAVDKRRAQRHSGRRIPEKRLFLAAACFGALGGVLGMRIMRHKTKHWYFAAGFPLLLIAQIAILAFGGYRIFR